MCLVEENGPRLTEDAQHVTPHSFPIQIKRGRISLGNLASTSSQLRVLSLNHQITKSYESNYPPPQPQSFFKMAPKNRNTRDSTPSQTTTTTTTTTIPSPSSPSRTTVRPSASKNQSPQQIALSIWQNYLDTTPQRTKLIDVFLSFLVVVGVLQFVYCVINGNFVRFTRRCNPACSLGICDGGTMRNDENRLRL